jgi:hypothetical protein
MSITKKRSCLNIDDATKLQEAPFLRYSLPTLFFVDFFVRLLSDVSESQSVGDVIDASLSVEVVDGVRSGDSGVGVAGLDLGGVDVVVAVVVVAEFIL